MAIFKLPHTANVQRIIPKNAFDKYTTTRQKRLFADLVSRITWSYKLSPDTVNLESLEVIEIQVFKIELKAKEDVQILLEVIDKAIPYHIIFIVEYEMEVYLSTSIKHAHPINEDNAVLDWTFRTSWFPFIGNSYQLNLKISLDAVYHDFCIQLSAKYKLASLSISELVQYCRQKDSLERQVEQLKRNIKSCRQYKRKVGLNMLLQQKINDLELLDN